MNHPRSYPSSGYCILLGLMSLMLHSSAFGAAKEGDGPPGRPDLTGVVRDEREKALAGASVFIYTAGPREGTGVLCPSCYADCRKRTTTDTEGRFKIEGLDPDLSAGNPVDLFARSGRKDRGQRFAR